MAGNPEGIPQPKRALTAYLTFLLERRPHVVAASPELSFGEVGKLIGNEWSLLTEAQRQPYVQRAAEDRARYKREVEAFPGVIQHNKSRVQKTKKAAAAAKKAKASNGEKRALSAYAYYMTATRAAVVSENPNFTFGEVGREVGHRWNALSEAERQPYKNMAEADRAAKAAAKA